MRSLRRELARPSRFALSAGAAMLAACGPVLALDGDRIRPSVGAVAAYYSNLFYLDDRIPPSAVPFLQNGQKSDWSRGLRLGLDADIPVSRQTFVLRSNVTQNNFATYETLDNTSYNVRGVWNWVAGRDWDGDLGTEQTQSLGSFVDVRGSDKNIRTVSRYFGSAMYRIFYDWKLRAGLSYFELQNSAERFRVLDSSETAYEIGSRYYSKGGDNYAGLNFRAIDGKFPNRQVVPGGLTLDNAFRQYTLEGVLDWRYSPTTFLEGGVGWTQRLNDQVSARDFSGVTGRLVWSYGLTGATAINARVFREIGPVEFLNASYILSQGFRVGPRYAYSEKLSLQADAGFTNRQFLGDPLIALGAPVRKDDVWSVSGSANWTPVLRAQVSATVSYETRTSSAILFDYDALTLFLSAQYSF